MLGFKGTVSTISSDSPFKDGNARFTTVPALFNEVWIRYQCLKRWKRIFFNCDFSIKVTWVFLLQEGKHLGIRNQIHLTPEKRPYLPHYWSDIGYRCESGTAIFFEGHLKLSLVSKIVSEILLTVALLKNCWLLLFLIQN